MGVHFIAMAVSLADVLIFIDRSDDAIPSQFGGISAKAHGAAQIAARFAFLQPFFTHPFRDEAHNRFVRRAKFGGGCLRKSGHMARTLDACHWHAKTHDKERMEESSVAQEWIRTWRSRWSRYNK